MAKRIKKLYGEYQLDSADEMHFAWWTDELTKAGFIREVIFHPSSAKLSEGLKIDYFVPHKKKEGGKMIPESIFEPHVYTPDVKIIWNDNAIGRFAEPLNSRRRKKNAKRQFMKLICQEMTVRHDNYPDKEYGDKVFYSIIEIKPSFDHQNMTRLAKLNVIWTWEKFGVFVNLVIPEKIFNVTFTPEGYYFTDSGKGMRKIKYKQVQSLSDYLKSIGYGPKI